MSEFSESFQLYGADRSAVASLLRGVGVGGLIAADNPRCVSFVIEDAEREDDIIAACPGVLARYYYGEDHGLWIRFYRDGHPLTTLALVWDRAVDQESEPEEVEPAAQIVDKLAGAGVIDALESNDLRQVIEGFSPEDSSAYAQTAQSIPKLLGFAAFRWLSAAYLLETPPEDVRKLFPGAEIVDIDMA
jgi:hypothetical protein